MMQGNVPENRRGHELNVLGCLAMSADAADVVFAELSAESFQELDLRKLFTVCKTLTERGIQFYDDPAILADALMQAGMRDGREAAATVAQTLECVPHALHVQYYVDILRAYHLRDRMRVAGERITAGAKDVAADPNVLLQNCLDHLLNLQDGVGQRDDVITTAAALEAYDQPDIDATVTTGIPSLDTLLGGGFRPGQLITIGARPGLGKSVLLQQILTTNAMRGCPGFHASLEMGPAELAGRALRTVSRDQYSKLPVFMSEESDLTRIISQLRQTHRRHGVGVCGVDYLQLAESPRERNMNRTEQIAGMSRRLKLMAMALKIPVVIAAQLNRNAEERERPILADLRESGAIEQDSDIVILIAGLPIDRHRELIVAKHRRGPCGIVRVDFDGSNFQFREPEIFTGHL